LALSLPIRLDRGAEELVVEREDAGVDLPDRALLVARVLLLDDRQHVAVVVADDPAVALRLVDDPGQDADRGLRRLVLAGEPPQRAALEERRVAVRDQDGAADRRDLLLVERVERDPYGVAGAELLVLDGEHRLRQALEDVRADLLALVADDRADPGRLEVADRREDMPDHAAAADLVQHLHRLGLHPGAAARGQDDDGQLLGHGPEPNLHRTSTDRAPNPCRRWPTVGP
jgi:hypothetical protein